jgi:hypothetical protein
MMLAVSGSVLEEGTMFAVEELRGQLEGRREGLSGCPVWRPACLQ